MRTCALLLMRVALSALNASRRNRHAISDRRATSQRQDAVKTDFTTETDFFVATSDSCFPYSFSPAVSSLLHGLFLTKYSYSRFGISQSVVRWFFTEYSSDGSVIELWQNSIRKKENRKRSHTETSFNFQIKNNCTSRSWVLYIELPVRDVKKEITSVNGFSFIRGSPLLNFVSYR